MMNLMSFILNTNFLQTTWKLNFKGNMIWGLNPPKWVRPPSLQSTIPLQETILIKCLTPLLHLKLITSTLIELMRSPKSYFYSLLTKLFLKNLSMILKILIKYLLILRKLKIPIPLSKLVKNTTYYKKIDKFLHHDETYEKKDTINLTNESHAILCGPHVDDKEELIVPFLCHT